MATTDCLTMLQSCVNAILSTLTSQPRKDPELLAAVRRFTPSELQAIQKIFTPALTGAQGAYAARNQLVAVLQRILRLEALDGHLAGRLYSILQSDKAGVTYDKFVITLASVIKGPPESLSQFAYELLTGAKEPVDWEKELRQNLHSLIAWVIASDPEGPLPQAIARGVLMSTEGRGFRTPGNFSSWLKSVPSISAAVRSLLDVQGRPVPSTPSKVPQPLYNRPRLLFSSSATHTASLEDCLMDEGLIWLLSSWVPPDQAEDWELLFNGQVNGASFNTFMGKAAERGPTMVLVRDKKGHVFGGYAAEGWAKHGHFYGSALCFIFSLLPAVVRYGASGANGNMLWCGQGFSQLPNGIGWGGKAGYFGLYVDSTFERGMSRPCSTYNNACLAADEVFDVDVVECWLLKQPDEAPPKASNGGSSSVLDKYKEDRHLMDLAGRTTQASAGVREARPEDEL